MKGDQRLFVEWKIVFFSVMIFLLLENFTTIVYICWMSRCECMCALFASFVMGVNKFYILGVILSAYSIFFHLSFFCWLLMIKEKKIDFDFKLQLNVWFPVKIVWLDVVVWINNRTNNYPISHLNPIDSKNETIYLIIYCLLCL